jgi:hypothetical protein
MKNIAFTILILGCFSPVFCKDLYFLGISSQWNNPENWSEHPGGLPCHCVPDIQDKVYLKDSCFKGISRVVIEGNVEVNSFYWNSGNKKLHLDAGINRISVVNDFEVLGNRISFQAGTMNFLEGGFYNAPDVQIYADVVFNKGNREFESILALGHNNSILCGKAHLNFRNQIVYTGELISTSNSRIEFGDARLYIRSKLDTQVGEIDFGKVKVFSYHGAEILIPKEVFKGLEIHKQRAACNNGFFLNLNITSNYNGSYISCLDSCDGELTAVAGGTTGPFSYRFNFSGGYTGETVYGNLCVGTYTVTAIDSSQNIVGPIYEMCSESVSIMEPPLLVVNPLGIQSPSCGACDGELIINISGGTSPITAQLENSGVFVSSGFEYISLCAGNYVINAIDINGCKTALMLNLSSSTGTETVTMNNTTLACRPEDCNGSLNVDYNCSDAPCIVNWTTGTSTTDSVFNLCTGVYGATVTNASGCVTSLSAEVLVPVNPFSLETESILEPNCGNNNGFIDMQVFNGTAPFAFNWSTGDTLDSAVNVYSGIYYVQVYDANGCYDDAVIHLSDVGAPTINTNLMSPLCHNSSNGSIDITVSGGTSPYQYYWSNGQITEDLIGLISGGYDLQITDAMGCNSFEAYLLTAPSLLETGISTVQPTCSASDGSIQAIITGGSLPYSILWDVNAGSQTTMIATGLSAGNYDALVTDANGCTVIVTGVLSNLTPEISLVNTVASDCGSVNGLIDISVTGGSSPYTYLWSDGTVLEDLINVSSGMYSVEITDATGCLAVMAFQVPQTLPPVMNQSICMVTVDTVTGLNVVVWEKPATSIVSSYNIYRESNTLGVYNLVGNVLYSDLSEFHDPVANPLVRPWRYKITAVDNCGYLGAQSTEHKTIHLQTGLGFGGEVNLQWDQYGGAAYNRYFISRRLIPGGWAHIDTVPANVHSYTDLNPPVGTVDYSVEADLLTPCASTRTNHNTTRSNKRSNGIIPNDIVESEFNIDRIYPNPVCAGKAFNVELNDYGTIEVYASDGKLILYFEAPPGLNVMNLPISAGSYLLRHESKKGVAMFKLVVINE